jgi:RNA polymerase sporulation-specific sigma factor
VCYSITISDKDANLFDRAQAGDVESLEQLMRRHEGLVHHIVHQQWRACLGYEGAIHAGRIGLWRAILGFDPERGYAFSTYASVAIARHVWRAVKVAERDERTTRAPAFATSCHDPRAEVLAWEVKATLHAMVARLPAKQRWVVCTYYGLDDWGGCALAQLGRRLGCSRQAVHYHLRKALLRLRHPAFSLLLRALLGRNRRADYLQALRAERRGQ